MWSGITEETKAIALSPARHIWCRAYVATKNVSSWTERQSFADTDLIVSAAVDIGARSGGIQVGGAYCAKLVLRLLDGADIRQTDRIIMRVGFYKSDGTKTQHISLGWFYVDTIKKANGIITVTAYDKMLRASKNYRSSLEYPAKISAVLEEICGKLGVNLADDFVIPEDGNISLKPVKGTDSEGKELYYTMRQVLSFLASAMGGNLFFDVGGHLQLTKFAKVSDVFAADNSIEADISADAYSVAGIVWTIGGVTYSRNDEDTAGIMEFENPLTFYPKETVQHAIEERVTGLSYHDGTILRQGCGWFELGDIVTAYRADGSAADVLITGISYEIKDGGFTEKIYSSALSESQDNFTTGDIPGATEPQSVSGAAQASPAGAITTYEYLSDPSVKLNGTTYTIEKNAAGLISKITDSLGNTLKPTISGEITDIALHNAALWGAVLARGIGKTGALELVMPNMSGITGYFIPETRAVSEKQWRNHIAGGNPIEFSNVSESGHAVHLDKTSYGSYSTLEPNTVYCIFRCSLWIMSSAIVWQPVITKNVTKDDVYYGFDLFSCIDEYCSYGEAAFSAISSDLVSDTPTTSYVVCAYSRSGSATRFFVNASEILKSFDTSAAAAPVTAHSGNYGGKMLLNTTARSNSVPSNNIIGEVDIIMCAFGTAYHTEEQIISNSRWLMQKLYEDWND